MKIFNNGSFLKAVWCGVSEGWVKSVHLNWQEKIDLQWCCRWLNALKRSIQWFQVLQKSYGGRLFPLVWGFCAVCKSGDPAFGKEIRLYEKHEEAHLWWKCLDCRWGTQRKNNEGEWETGIKLGQLREAGRKCKVLQRRACLKDGIYWSVGDKLLGSQYLVNAPDLVRRREMRELGRDSLQRGKQQDWAQWEAWIFGCAYG